MDQLEVPQNRSCWICFNNENNITLTTLTFERLLKNCATCLDFSIIKKSFQNQTSVSCCAYCFESARQLTLVKDQIEELQKEVSDLSLLFAKNILERRNRIQMGEDQSIIISTSPTDTDFAIHKNPYPHYIIVTENLSVKNESCIKSLSNELPSDSEENSDPLLNADVPENIIEEKFHIDIHSDSAENIDSYDERVSTSVEEKKDQKKIVPDREILATKKHGDQEPKKTGFTDVLNCLKLPIDELERIHHCRGGRSPKTVAAAGEETIKHENDLEENKPYKCSICGQGFVRMGDLEDHDKLHYKERSSYPCSVCDESFPKPSLLKVHERYHTENRPYTCSFCTKSFKKISNLKAHESIHSEEKPFKCAFCGKLFKLSKTLKVHENIHSEKRPYKCSWCEKSFLLPAALKIHERFHTGERPFGCSFCPKSFTSSSTLRCHEAIHSENKPYKCSLCLKSFTKQSVFQIHERIHTGERPYNCSICSKSFVSTSELKRHARIVHTTERP